MEGMVLKFTLVLVTRQLGPMSVFRPKERLHMMSFALKP